MSSSLTRSSRNSPGYTVAVAALLIILGGVARAQAGADDPANHAWQADAIRHAQKMRRYIDRDHGKQSTPPIIPRFEEHLDPSGRIATFQPGGPTPTAGNAFFQNLTHLLQLPSSARRLGNQCGERANPFLRQQWNRSDNSSG